MIRALAKRDYRIRVGVRRPDLAGHLQPLGKVGQIHAVQANLRYPASVAGGGARRQRDRQSGGNPVRGRRADLRCGSGQRPGDRGPRGERDRRAHGACLGHRADVNSTSRYARAKAAGEAAVLAATPSATIIRPSVVFGPEDHFTNRFAGLARISPMLPLIGGGLTKMQPVYVGDVADAIADAVDGKTKAGATYELGGPEVMTMREILEVILRVTERNSMLVPLPFPLARLKSFFLQFAPGDSQAHAGSGGATAQRQRGVGRSKDRRIDAGRLGITPDSLEAVTPSYLWRYRKTGQFAHKGA